MNTKHANALDRVFASLANTHRRQIVYALGLHPASISQLAKQQRLSLPAIHRHVKVLEKSRLVRRKKRGRVNFLALDRSGLLMMQEWVLQYQAYWGTQEETLENYVAGIERHGTSFTKSRRVT